MVAPMRLMEGFGDFQELVGMDTNLYVADWAAGEHTLEETAAEIERLDDLFSAVNAKSESIVRFKLVAVDVSEAQAELRSRAATARTALQRWVESGLDEANVAVVARFEEIISKLREDPTTTEEMDELEKFVAAVEAELVTILDKIEQSKQVAEVLSQSRYNLDLDVTDRFYELLFWPARLDTELASVKERLHRCAYHAPRNAAQRPHRRRGNEFPSQCIARPRVAAGCIASVIGSISLLCWPAHLDMVVASAYGAAVQEQGQRKRTPPVGSSMHLTTTICVLSMLCINDTLCIDPWPNGLSLKYLSARFLFAAQNLLMCCCVSSSYQNASCAVEIAHHLLTRDPNPAVAHLRFRNRYKIQLEDDQAQLTADLAELHHVVQAFVLLGEFRLVDDRLMAGQDIEERLTR